MDRELTPPGASAHPLRDALRRARIEAAEHSQAVSDIRDAELARLAILKDALAPVLADVPPGVDIFDLALLPGHPPRLFVDLVAHVSMARDKHTYRFVRDIRGGRQLLAENTAVEPIVAAVTAYVARRLVEREQVLAEGPAAGSAGETAAAIAVTPSDRAPTRLAVALAFFLGGLLGAGLMAILR